MWVVALFKDGGGCSFCRVNGTRLAGEWRVSRSILERVRVPCLVWHNQREIVDKVGLGRERKQRSTDPIRMLASTPHAAVAAVGAVAAAVAAAALADAPQDVFYEWLLTSGYYWREFWLFGLQQRQTTSGRQGMLRCHRYFIHALAWGYMHICIHTTHASYVWGCAREANIYTPHMARERAPRGRHVCALCANFVCAPGALACGSCMLMLCCSGRPTTTTCTIDAQCARRYSVVQFIFGGFSLLLYLLSIHYMAQWARQL